MGIADRQARFLKCLCELFKLIVNEREGVDEVFTEAK